MRTNRRVVILTLAITLLFTVMAVPAQAGPAGSLLSKINSARSSAGLAPLETYWDLTDDARANTNKMVANQAVSHSSNLSGVTSVWQGIAENVGVHYSVDELHSAFMASSGHRSNILGDFNYVGIGAVEDDGKIWATVIFMRAAPGLNDPEETTTTTAAPTTTTTAPPTTTTTPPAPETTTTTAPPATGSESTTTTTTPPPAETAETVTWKQSASSLSDSSNPEVTFSVVVEPLGHPDSATIAD